VGTADDAEGWNVRLWYAAALLGLFVIVGEFAGATSAFDVVKAVLAGLAWMGLVVVVVNGVRERRARRRDQG
jgi:hypothetical protein